MTEKPPEPLLSDMTGGLADVWTCGFRAWSGYLAHLLNARGVDDVMQAQTRLYLESCGLFGQAAGEMLKRHGLTAPTLNEP